MNLSEIFIKTQVLTEMETVLQEERQRLEKIYRNKIHLIEKIRTESGMTLNPGHYPTILMIYDIGLDEFIERCRWHQKQAANLLHGGAAAKLALQEYLEETES